MDTGLILAGFPQATEYGGIFDVTTLLAPMTEPSPIVTPGSIVTLSPIQTLSPMIIVPFE